MKRIVKESACLRQFLTGLLTLTLLSVALPAYAITAPTISTVVPSVTSGGITVDAAGNLYYMDYADANKNSCVIYQRTPGGLSTPIAGGGTIATGIEGSLSASVPATNAYIGMTYKTVSYAGALYFADTGSMRIRKVADGQVYTVLGEGTNQSELDPTDPIDDNTRISSPRGLAFGTAGNLYFSEFDANKVRMLTAMGTLTTIAGTNVFGVATAGYSGDSGPATSAQLNHPSGIALDADGNLYIADLSNHVIREVAATNHTQYGIDMQAGYIYTVAGGGANTAGGIAATSCRLSYPRDVIVDGDGTLYICDLHRVCAVDASGTLRVLAGQLNVSGDTGDDGSAPNARLNFPSGLALDGDGNLLVADTQNGKIRKIAFPSPSPSITTTSLPDGIVGTTYRALLTASSGTGIYSDWTATGLPDGMRLTVTGKLLGVPELAGYYDVTVTVTDSDGKSGTKTLGLDISAAADSPLSHWTERSKPDSLSDSSVYDIAYDGNTLVGVGDGIMTSADGAVWTADKAAEQLKTYQGIAYGNGTFVAVGWQTDSGMISTKKAGGTWEDKTPSGIKSLEGVAYAGNNTFIAVGDNTILVSTDGGDNWSTVIPPALPGGVTFRLHGVASDGNGYAVAVGDSSNGEAVLWYVAEEQNAWSAQSIHIEGTRLNSVACNNHVYVAIGVDGTAYVSVDDGATWDYSEIPGGNDATPPIMNKIAYGGGIFVAVGHCEAGQYNVVSSADNGLTWTERISSPNAHFQAIAYGSNSFVQAGYAIGTGRLYQSDALTSPVITTGTISGTVTDGTNPVSGAAVSLTVNGSVYSATTAVDGSYSIPNVPAGAGYAVIASKSGFESGSATNVNVTANSTTSGVNITLAAIPPVTTYTITFNANGGSISPATMQTGVNGKLVSLPAPTISGSYSFNGWFTAATGGSAVTADTVFTANTTVYAHWTYTGGGSGGSGGGSYTPAPKYEASVSGGDVSAKIEVKVDAKHAPVPAPAVKFTDVLPGAWYYDAVTFMANKGITSGTGQGKFSPDARLTRGQFITMLLRAYSVSADAKPANNFSDAGDTYYTGYLAAAKRLGISTGVGSNMFAPGKEITRQEMFTLLYNALKTINRLPQGNSGKTLSDFTDAGQIDSWAKDAMTALIKAGTVTGTGGKLNPTGTTTRAEMAQMLYSLLGK